MFKIFGLVSMVTGAAVLALAAALVFTVGSSLPEVVKWCILIAVTAFWLLPSFVIFAFGAKADREFKNWP